MSYTKRILETTRYVSHNAKHITLRPEKIKQFCQNFNEQKDTNWLDHTPFSLTDLTKKEMTHLMLTFNALSFSYWGDPYWQVTYEGTTHQRGSWSLIAALLRARKEGTDIFDPTIQADVTARGLGYILRGNREIPLLNERSNILNQVGRVIRNDYKGDFKNIIDETLTAPELLETIIETIPSFDDTASYQGKNVFFYKRAQALVQSMAVLHQLPGTDELTALADYILPRKLRDEGILEYDQELAYIVDNNILILPKSTYELEIRASTIQAVEEIKRGLTTRNILITSKGINDHLWLTGAKEQSNYHRTRTTDY